MEFVNVKPKKVVTFRHYVEICFIPRKEEYQHIKQSLWYQKADYILFYKDANRFVF
jgi:hypothetical protein